MSTAPPAASGTDSSLLVKPKPPFATGAAANKGVTCAAQAVLETRKVYPV